MWDPAHPVPPLHNQHGEIVTHVSLIAPIANLLPYYTHDALGCSFQILNLQWCTGAKCLVRKSIIIGGPVLKAVNWLIIIVFIHLVEKLNWSWMLLCDVWQSILPEMLSLMLTCSYQNHTLKKKKNYMHMVFLQILTLSSLHYAKLQISPRVICWMCIFCLS